MTRPRGYIRYIGNGLSALSVLFVAVRLISNPKGIELVSLSTESLVSLAAALGLFSFSAVSGAYAWVLLLKGGGVSVSLKEAYAIIGKAQIAKYLPGNIFQFVGRVSLGTDLAIPAGAVVVSMAVETGAVALAAAIVSGAGLLMDPVGFGTTQKILGQQSHTLAIWAIPLVIIVITLILVGSRTLRQWIIERLAFFNPVAVISAMALYGAVFLTAGLVITWIVSAIFGMETSTGWFHFAAGFSLAWLLGFIVPGAPGGIGIREAVFVGLFGNELGQGVAVGLAVLLRIITSLSDLLTFGIATLIARKLPPPAR